MWSPPAPVVCEIVTIRVFVISSFPEWPSQLCAPPNSTASGVERSRTHGCQPRCACRLQGHEIPGGSAVQRLPRRPLGRAPRRPLPCGPGRARGGVLQPGRVQFFTSDGAQKDIACLIAKAGTRVVTALTSGAECRASRSEHKLFIHWQNRPPPPSPHPWYAACKLALSWNVAGGSVHGLFV